jgi:hypothetical protein
MHNHVELVSFLLKEGADVNQGNATKKTPLMLAAERHHITILKLLIEHPDIDTERRDLCGWTALMYAIPSVRCSELLLYHGKANADVVDNAFTHLIVRTVQKGMIEVLRCIYDTHPLLLKAPVTQEAFTYAVERNDYYTVQFFLRLDIMPTLEHMDRCITYQHVNMATLLLNHGAPVTPQHLSLPCTTCNDKLLVAMLRKNVDLNVPIRVKWQETPPLYCLPYHNAGSFRLAHRMIAAGAKPDIAKMEMLVQRQYQQPFLKFIRTYPRRQDQSLQFKCAAVIIAWDIPMDGHIPPAIQETVYTFFPLYKA